MLNEIQKDEMKELSTELYNAIFKICQKIEDHIDSGAIEPTPAATVRRYGAHMIDGYKMLDAGIGYGFGTAEESLVQYEATGGNEGFVALMKAALTLAQPQPEVIELPAVEDETPEEGAA